MAKKRKATGRSVPAEETNGFEKKGGRIGPITTYEDVADSEDEFHMNHDKIMLDDGPEAKRQRKWEEEDPLLAPSDEEILGYSSEDDEDVDVRKSKKSAAAASDDDEVQEDEEEEEEGWGTSKKDYYDNDQVETEADALEEEAEAKRLQQKKLQKMSGADFGFDEAEWLDAGNNEDGDADVVTEVLKDVEITKEMSSEEQRRILQQCYPEFDYLAEELLQWEPVLAELQKEAESETYSALELLPISVVKYRALAAYVICLSMYFGILTSPSRDGQGGLLHPVELRDHSVMESLLRTRKLWTKVKSLKSKAAKPQIIDAAEISSNDEEVDIPSTNGDILPISSKKSKREKARLAEAKKAANLRAQQIAAAEEDLADLSNLIPKSRKLSKKSKLAVVEDDSDFGEEETMDAKSAAEKAQRKKSLRFYTSQIAQKANKRADAGRDAGGDNDFPHRERLRDRQARLNAEAEARGKKMNSYGRGDARTALGGESDEEAEFAEAIRDEGDEYYDLVAKTSKKKKDDKAAKIAAIAQAKAENGLVRVVEKEVDEDGKRAIGYVIEKNKGLAPKRKKDVRNPRVKKKKKYEEKMKKLSSMKATYKGGEERGGYGGEKTGIKPGLVKSIKL